MANCPNCKSELVMDGLNAGQQFRCANCQEIGRFGDTEKIPANKLAWRSLWLGLASIFLLFITGLPAIYYGIRSLLRMRFVRSKPSDRAAAVAGTALGGCFGICIGSLAAMILAVVLFTVLTHEESEEPDVVMAKCQQVFNIEVPEGFVPVKSESVSWMQESFDFADEQEVADRSARIHLKYFGSSLQTNEGRLVKSLKSKRPNRQRLGKSSDPEILEWHMEGEPVEVRKTIFEASEEADGAKATHQYFGLLRTDHGYYGACVVYEPDDFSLTEEQVEQFFANLGPAGQKKETETGSSRKEDENVEKIE